MAARFVCPAAQLGALADRWGAGDGAPLVVAAIGGGGGDLAALLQQTREDVTAAVAAGRPGVVVDQIEVRLPPAVVAGGSPAVQETVERLCDLIRPLAHPAVMLAVEAPVAGAEPPTVAAAIAGIAAHNRRAAQHGELPVAFKMRCGGLSASAVPSPAEVAAALIAGRDDGVAVKATQGLHHPFRRPDAALGTATHGFVNLLAAAALARAAALAEGEIVELLDDRRPEHFVLGAESLTWRGFTATVNDLAATRRHALMSFGSCSFAEPQDDLVALGWLPL